MVDFWVPDESSGEIVSPDRLEAMAVRLGIDRWRRLAAGKRHPGDVLVLPRILGPLLNNCILIRVLDDGADYEYRIVGQTLVGGFAENFAGRRLTAIIAERPKFGIGLRMLYEMVRTSGEPLGYRGWAGRDMGEAQFSYHESVLLPFGGDRVDHILVISAIVPRTDIMTSGPERRADI